ncbi:MAG: hypothetical protein LDL31_07780 [Prosthecobacter sp.]|nr:hypothetical protein [Prosthecobacter sp.]
MKTLLICLVLGSTSLAAAETIPRVPVPDGDPWDLCHMPDLGPMRGPDPKKQHIVDHGFLRRPDGGWTLWACLRGTAAGRVLFGWEGESLEKGPWQPLGIVARAAPAWGENARTGPNLESGTVRSALAPGEAPKWPGEVIQAPHFLEWQGQFLCFYNSNGIRLMTSPDGRTFTRRGTQPDGNLLYADGGRDVMVLPIGDVLHAYSTISTKDGRGYVMLRTSTDLKTWTPGKNVNEGGPGGSGPISAESPFVVALDGFFYLFRASSDDGKTYVYRSATPDDFGVNDSSKLIATLKLKAPEIIHHEGQWFISDLGDFQSLKLRRLRWDKSS